jgi:hypothetical protein
MDSRELFKIIIEANRIFSTSIASVTMNIDKEIDFCEKYNDDNLIEEALYFEGLALIYTSVSKALYFQNRKLWENVQRDLLQLVFSEFDEIFTIKRNRQDLEVLFLDRIIQYDEGDLKLLLLNMKMFNFHRIKENKYLGVKVDDSVKLYDNSRLFYYWNCEPLSKDTRNFELEESDESTFEYKSFLERYYSASIKFTNDLHSFLITRN